VNDILLALTAIAILIAWLFTMRTKDEDFADERKLWHEERQQLLDRIQAGSFAEYKHAEVKVIKAQNGEKEPPKLEPM
jgi:hypothetical protein